MKKPTEYQVMKEIDALKSMKPNVRRFTKFGDDNWEKIEAEIEALSNGMSIDDTYDKWPDGDEDFEVRSSAQDAIRWRDGESQEKPSDGWKPLMEK